jgi:hypothetical protein
MYGKHLVIVTLTTGIMFPVHVHALLGAGKFTKLVRMCVDRPPMK